MVAFLIC